MWMTSRLHASRSHILNIKTIFVWIPHCFTLENTIVCAQQWLGDNWIYDKQRAMLANTLAVTVIAQHSNHGMNDDNQCEMKKNNAKWMHICKYVCNTLINLFATEWDYLNNATCSQHNPKVVFKCVLFCDMSKISTWFYFKSYWKVMKMERNIYLRTGFTQTLATFGRNIIIIWFNPIMSQPERTPNTSLCDGSLKSTSTNVFWLLLFFNQIVYVRCTLYVLRENPLDPLMNDTNDYASRMCLCICMRMSLRRR